MKRLLGVMVIVGLVVLIAGPALAQGPRQAQPARALTKELVNNSPRWVAAEVANCPRPGAPMAVPGITGMTCTPTGWAGDPAHEIKPTPPDRTHSVLNRGDNRFYPRQIFRVSFERMETHASTVVFEDYGEDLKAFRREEKFMPVLVEKQPEPPRPTPAGWVYE